MTLLKFLATGCTLSALLPSLAFGNDLLCDNNTQSRLDGFTSDDGLVTVDEAYVCQLENRVDLVLRVTVDAAPSDKRISVFSIETGPVGVSLGGSLDMSGALANRENAPDGKDHYVIRVRDAVMQMRPALPFTVRVSWEDHISSAGLIVSL